MFKWRSSTVETITPDRATELIKLNTLSQQRPIRPSIVENYRRLMETHEFRRGEIAIAAKLFSTDAQNQVLVNGQHQLTAAIAAEEPFDALVDVYEVASESELWQLYASFDVHCARTDTDVLRAAHSMFEDQRLRVVPFALLRGCERALAALDGGDVPAFTAPSPSKLGKVKLLEEFADDVVWIATHYDDTTAKLFRVPVVTAMIATHRVAADRADDFWRAVLRGGSLEERTTLWQTNRFVLNPEQEAALGASGQQRHVRAWNYLATMWNAWLSGDNSRLRVNLGRIQGLVELDAPEQALAAREVLT